MSLCRRPEIAAARDLSGLAVPLNEQRRPHRPQVFMRCAVFLGAHGDLHSKLNRICGHLRFWHWQGRQDSNPRPAVLETFRSMRCALYLGTHALCAKTAAVWTEDHLRPRLFARRRDRRLREPLTRAAGARTGEDYNISAQSASLTPELPVRTTGPGTWQGRPTAWEAQGRFFGPIAHFVFGCPGPNDIRLMLTLAIPLSICLLPAARSSEGRALRPAAWQCTSSCGARQAIQLAAWK